MNTVTLSLKDYEDLILFKKAVMERTMIGVYYNMGVTTYYIENSERVIEDLNRKLFEVQNENLKLKREIIELGNKKLWQW